jgi:hypothetical protein
MRTVAWSFTCAATVFGIAETADAHSFVCEKTVNGGSLLEVTSYPTTLHYEFTVINDHPSDPSVYTDVSDPSLAGFAFDPPAPYEVPVGQSVTDTFDVVLSSPEQCSSLAAADGIADDAFVNTFTVTWESGQAVCSARVDCAAPPPAGGATRTPGFYKTHVDAMAQCLEGGPIDLGFLTIATLEEALGLLWAVPAKYESGEHRSKLDKARFILGRHTLVATCNERLFGTEPTPATLIADAVAALASTDCALMMELAALVDAFNNSGDDEPLPDGFVAGPATPRAAAGMGDDPTSPSGESCL